MFMTTILCPFTNKVTTKVDINIMTIFTLMYIYGHINKNSFENYLKYVFIRILEKYLKYFKYFYKNLF